MKLPEKGSRWYWAGRHYEIAGYGMKDGEPAVYVRSVNTRGKARLCVIWRLMERHSLPSVA